MPSLILVSRAQYGILRSFPVLHFHATTEHDFGVTDGAPEARKYYCIQVTEEMHVDYNRFFVTDRLYLCTVS